MHLGGFFSHPSQEFVYYRTYSRWIDESRRRETWPETVSRVVNFLKEECGSKVPDEVFEHIHKSILAFDVMPSMRLVWSAGPAARRDNLTIYNCAFTPLDSVEAFAECLYILMCGTGVGFSVEKKYVERLPKVPQIVSKLKKKYIVSDDKSGWADSLKVLMEYLYNGIDVEMDYSKIRPKGSRLKVMGGRASGPDPLQTLHCFVRETFIKAQGRNLTPLECHDIANQIAEIVVAGGVRRSSQISLSDLEDAEMRNAKVWPFPLRRAMANNSAVYYSKPSEADFWEEWTALKNSGSGERGIFNLGSAQAQAPARRDASKIIGTNPCAEISLRGSGLCNLSEVVIKPTDSRETLLSKVETATWIGVLQSTLTYFPYLSDEWRLNCEEERLLGVSLTGQMDAPHLLTEDLLSEMKALAQSVAKNASEIIGIKMPAAITCVKPSGTVSQLVNSSSGMHCRYAPYYIRRYRISATDPLLRCLKSQGVVFTPENGQSKDSWEKAKETGVIDFCPIYKHNEEWTEDKVVTWVVSFPIAAPDDSLKVKDMNALQQLEHYKKIQTNWCEHNASMTVYVKENEWELVGKWVYDNWQLVNGLSFLPFDGGKYEQAPYEEISKEEYDRLTLSFPKIDLTNLSLFEEGDETEGAKSYACVGGACEI
jgi:ribonucleoside-diphosphate reductase alpha chain